MINISDMIDDRYKVRAFLGHGGMSDVYEAHDIIMKRIVAIKILNEASMNIRENQIRFENEARIASSLYHPNIVKIYNYGKYKGQAFIVNEFQKGQTLKDALNFKGYFSLAESCQIMIQVLSALAFMHQKGIIHRDIKPQNIFYGTDGIAKVSDFGISIIKGSKMGIDEYKKVVGTVHYMAPEVIKGAKANEQSDIYSAGVTFLELLTGCLPFMNKGDEDNINKIAIAHIKYDIPSPLSFMVSLPKETEDIVFKATNKDLSLRYKSANEMKNDIERLYQNKSVISKSFNFFDRIFNSKRRK